jgi:Holliday junction resolvase RusA-like endonuclease
MPQIYVINGNPLAWTKPARIGSSKKFYDTQRMFKTKWAITLESQHNQPMFCDTPLEMTIHFHFPPPDTYRPERKQSLEGQPYIYNEKITELLRFAVEACQAILFDHESHIYTVQMSKTYSVNPRTEFYFTPFKKKRARCQD